MSKTIFTLVITIVFFSSCGETKTEQNSGEEKQPELCDCVNHDYHQEGDEEKCKKIEKDLTDKLEKATKDEKGEILMKIQDCKVKGQYDND